MKVLLLFLAENQTHIDKEFFKKTFKKEIFLNLYYLNIYDYFRKSLKTVKWKCLKKSNRPIESQISLKLKIIQFSPVLEI